MFTPHSHNPAKKSAEGEAKSADAAQSPKDPRRPNPVWQSLAMRSGIVQAKLTVGRADDPYECEADRVADQVMRMSVPPSDGHGPSITHVTADQAQRNCAECEEDEEEGAMQRKESGGAEAPATAPPIVHQTLSSPGQPLDATTRAYFEPRFGHSFADVRLHTGEEADVAARGVSARAFTVANQIAFAAGQDEPHSEAGRRLLAHELTHVAQQEMIGQSSERMLLQREPNAPDPRVNEDLEKPGVSYELGNPPTPTADELALGLPPPENAFLQGLDEDRRRVMGWLRQYKDEIQMQEVLRGVDRRAIAGAIAWEALVNVKESVDQSRAAGGPGKVHVQSSHLIDMRLAAPAEVEERGLVPKRTYDERVEILKTPGGAIDYIGAIMQAMAEDAETSGFDIWRDPAVLTWGYHSKYVDTFRERMQEKAKAGETVFDTSSSDMAMWTVGNLHYLELCVGEPSARNTGPAAPNLEPLPGGPTP